MLLSLWSCNATPRIHQSNCWISRRLAACSSRAAARAKAADRREPKRCPLAHEYLLLRRLTPVEVVWRRDDPPVHYRPGVRAPAAAYALTRRDPYPGGQNSSAAPIDDPRRKNAMRFLKWVLGDTHHRCLRRSRCITWTARQYNRKRMIAKESFGVMAFLIAHERIRTPNEKYSGERIVLKPVF